jgi:hypothetical protein
MNIVSPFAQSILSRIENLAYVEKMTKGILSTLSRDLLTYLVVEDSNDIAMVNRLLGVLTPMNKKTAQIFFAHFLPFTMDKDGTFGGKVKGEKKLTKVREQCLAFLAVESNDIWTWATANIKMEQKEIDYSKRISDTIAKALDEEKGGLSQADVLEAVLDGGLTVEGLMVLLGSMAKKAA